MPAYSVCCEDFGENWPCYNGAALYIYEISVSWKCLFLSLTSAEILHNWPERKDQQCADNMFILLSVWTENHLTKQQLAFFEWKALPPVG